MRKECHNVEGPSSVANQDVTATLKYSDVVNNKEIVKQIVLNSTTTIESIEMIVRQEFDIHHDNFMLTMHSNEEEVIYLQAYENKACPLGELDIHLNPQLKYTITASPSDKRNMALYVSDTAEDDLLLGASASPTAGDLPLPDAAPAVDYCPLEECGRCSVGPAGDSVESTSTDVSDPETINYVGLVNQAMTCYLNSLVQALFMTPEFRNAIYNWEYDGQNEARSIPYQLQRLFLNLQTSTRAAVETTDLTTSFGWQGSEAWHQHDIQELCRVMFDALERKFKDTKQANLINDLYEGKMLDYVKCLECGTEKSREDTFLDIPLPVRPFGSTVAYNSVEEALRAFVQPETLDGNNQYHCEKCNKKCDAHKGLKFMKFPYLLTLHLKRFDFDYNTMHRIKLNDKVVFPERLNLNSFVPNNRNESDNYEKEVSVKCDECSTTDSGSALDDESCQGTDLSSTVNDHDCEDSDEGIDVSSGNVHHENEAKGPYNYELFSIMIHSGSASGGHYYAYIKDFDRNQWLCFNDQSVNKITDEDIKKTYGGGPQKGYYSGVYTSSTNAYMLMYRQVDLSRNTLPMKLEDFPPHMHRLLLDMRDKDKVDKLQKERQINSFRLTVYCCNPHTEELMDVRMSLMRDSTLADGAQMAHRRFKLDGIVDLDDCRLVVYNKKQGCVDYNFEDEETKIDDAVDSLQMFQVDWFLEVRRPGTEWPIYKKGGINVRTYVVNVEAEDVREPIFLRIDVNDTVSQLKTKLSELFIMRVELLQVALVKFCNEPEQLDDDSMIIPIDYNPEFKLYVSNCLDEDSEKNFEDSKFKRIVERFENVVHLNVLLPDTDPATLESMCIPSLDSTQNLDSLRNSPQPGAMMNCVDNFGDQSNSEDSSLSDSDRTLVGDAPDECHAIFSSTCTSPTDHPMPSPTSSPGDAPPPEEMSWDTTSPPKQPSYFKLTSTKYLDKSHSSIDPSPVKLCRVFVDNRTTLDGLKRHLELILRVPKEYFKIYRPSPSPDEEWSSLSDTLRLARDGQTLSVRLGRALGLNEYSCKVFLLRLGSTDTSHFLFEHVVSRGQTVGHVKRDVLLKAKKLHMLDLPPVRCRLREKSLKKPRKVYLDEQVFGDDVTVLSGSEFYLQELDGPERVVSATQIALFARHWHPSTLTLDPFEEVVVDGLGGCTVTDLKTKIGAMSEIPAEFVQVAFQKNSFPCEMHVLDVHNELDWEPNSSRSEHWRVQAEDGGAFFYRDSREKLKELSYEEKREINISENARLGRTSAKSNATFEKSLRIYLDNWPSESEDNCID